MYITLNKSTIAIIFIFISIIGFFLPWFYFEETVDFQSGLFWLKNPALILGYTIIISLQFLNKYKISMFFILFIILYLIYIFLTWHILTITGEFDIKVSFSTAHYGFYVSLISMIIAFILNISNLTKYN